MASLSAPFFLSSYLEFLLFFFHFQVLLEINDFNSSIFGILIGGKTQSVRLTSWNNQQVRIFLERGI